MNTENPQNQTATNQTSSSPAVPSSRTPVVPSLNAIAQIEKLKADVPKIGILGEVRSLSDDEYLKLITYEEVVSMASASAFEAGRALAQIKAEGLWRGNYAHFEDYHISRWHFRRTQVHYMIGTARVCDVLKTVPDLPVPEFQSQLRPLMPLQPDEMVAVWRKAAQRAGKRRITAALVSAAVKNLRVGPGPDPKQVEKRRQRQERRLQMRQAMADLLEGIMGHKPHQELVQTAAALDSHLRYFFPPPRK